MKIAVIGAGVFGCTVAVDLARAGFEVELFERHQDIVWGATRACQARLHRGYHYPRSPETATAANDAYGLFIERYPGSIVQHFRHHYLIAAEGSQTDTAAFVDHMRARRLPFRSCAPAVVNAASVDMCVRVPEAFVDVKALRMQLRTDLLASGVKIWTDTAVSTNAHWPGYERVVDCTYGASGGRPLRYEVCEVALIRLGPHFRGQSFVVMDGPFVSLDPLPGHPDLHMVYDVRHSVHAAADGEVPTPAVLDLVDRGRLYTDRTHVDEMTHTLRRYLRGVGMPEYCGSMFAVRAVLPNVDASDARPTLVEGDGQLVRVLSGKIGTAVTAARWVTRLVGGVSVPA